MNRNLIRLLQQKLADAGFHRAGIDGLTGPETARSVAAALTAGSSRLPADWQQWSEPRQLIAYLQLAAHDAGINAGKIDGLWGPQTAFAGDSLETLGRTGSLPDNWRDHELRPKPNPNRWPKPDQASLDKTFGLHGLPGGRSPAIAYVECPWTFKISYDRRQTTRRIGCNAKVAESLGKVLARVWDHYSETEIKALGLDLYGGCYEPRLMRGGSSLSTHSWAIALDWDPDHNQLKWGRDRARLAGPDYNEWWQAWEGEGWLSLGRERNYDWMHVQATTI
jgi:peptidoglycan hydrolase-like protein with peptidoglycan-binding domain